MAQGYPLHIPEYSLYNIGLKYLPESALEELADILDVPNGVCMELFAENINREHENKLGLNTSMVQAFRYQIGQRPTKLLFRLLMKLGITIGQVQYVLDKMGAATRHIFRNSYNDIIQMYRHDITRYSSTSTATASEHNCTCIGCRERDVRDPHMYEGRLPLNVQPSQPRQRGIELDWLHPSECDCQCGNVNCKECEERRLLDPEETTVLSSYPPREYRNRSMNTRRSNNISSRTTGHVPVNNGMHINNNVQTDYISYSENPSSSFSLRACPDGNSHSSSMKSSITSKHVCSNTDTLKCTCKKPPVCTCRKGEVQISCSGDGRKRLSTPVEKLYASEIDSSRLSEQSISDPNLSTYPGDRRIPLDQSGISILISYTDDVKQDVIKIAGKLKRQGHTVNTDLHKESFVSAKNQGFVSERDQYTWLRNRFNHADYIIICSSKGYIEAINLDDKVCPSPHYLNAKYIFELIMQDPRKSEKTIEICFHNTYVKDKLCLPFTRKFILPNEMDSLFDKIRR